ncbi:MAG TPA: nucleotidyltransferase [Blastocatellia bacterium]|nr:nucleotidyltransferase [Blastocatellia bacterium]
MSKRLRIPEGDLSLLRELQRYEIRFVIIGGHAVRFHGVERGVDDLDLVVNSAGKAENLAAAILKVAGVSVNDVAYLETPYKQAPLKNLRLYSEILTSIKGVEFEEAYQAANVVEVEGVTVRVISKEHLIRHKRAVGREKDLEDVERLEALATL